MSWLDRYKEKIRKIEKAAKAETEEREQKYNRQIDSIFEDTLSAVQKEIDSFFAKYATDAKITMAEAKKAVKNADVKEYSKKAEKYVAERNFSDQANAEMKLYNATMKINRLELLKAQIGLELVSGFDELNDYMGDTLTEESLLEFKRQSGILGEFMPTDVDAMARAIMITPFNEATFTDRCWMHYADLSGEIADILRHGFIQGKGSREMAAELRKRTDISARDAQSLMRTELRRVQTQTSKSMMLKNGYDSYRFLTTNPHGPCDECQKLDWKVFKLSEQTIGVNAPPMHTNCFCTVAPAMDEDKYNEWIDSFDWEAAT